MNQQPEFRRIIGGLPQCSGHCQQGRSVCDCDPSLPIGQDEPEPARGISGAALLVIGIVLVILCAALVVWGVHAGVLAVGADVPVHVPVVSIKGMV